MEGLEPEEPRAEIQGGLPFFIPIPTVEPRPLTPKACPQVPLPERNPRLKRRGCSPVGMQRHGSDGVQPESWWCMFGCLPQTGQWCSSEGSTWMDKDWPSCASKCFQVFPGSASVLLHPPHPQHLESGLGGGWSGGAAAWGRQGIGRLQGCESMWKGASRPGPSGKGMRSPASPPPQVLRGRGAPPKYPPDLAFEMPEPAERRMKDRPRGYAFTAFVWREGSRGGARA